jgi:hypothetical protein
VSAQARKFCEDYVCATDECGVYGKRIEEKSLAEEKYARMSVKRAKGYNHCEYELCVLHMWETAVFVKTFCLHPHTLVEL